MEQGGVVMRGRLMRRVRQKLVLLVNMMRARRRRQVGWLLPLHLVGVRVSGREQVLMMVERVLVEMRVLRKMSGRGRMRMLVRVLLCVRMQRRVREVRVGEQRGVRGRGVGRQRHHGAGRRGRFLKSVGILCMSAA